MILFYLALFVPQSQAAEPWNTEIDTADLSEMQIGFTYIVPPDLIRQSHKAEQTESGSEWELSGVELSAWQTIPTPRDARYLLKWHFVYEGEILQGDGRTGFIFGNPDYANLLSVEITRGGTLRLLIWGMEERGRVGRVAWSKPVRRRSNRPVRIEADYDIRRDTLVCRVDDGEPIPIRLGDYMSSGPMTIKAVGFFAAVQEADIQTRGTYRPLPREYEIDLRTQHTRVLHRRLAVSAE